MVYNDDYAYVHDAHSRIFRISASVHVRRILLNKRFYRGLKKKTVAFRLEYIYIYIYNDTHIRKPLQVYRSGKKQDFHVFRSLKIARERTRGTVRRNTKKTHHTRGKRYRENPSPGRAISKSFAFTIFINTRK